MKTKTFRCPPHHYVLERPHEGASRGRCQKCGALKTFRPCTRDGHNKTYMNAAQRTRFNMKRKLQAEKERGASFSNIERAL